MDETATADAAAAVGAMIEVGTDLFWRFLVDRETLSARASLVLNRLNREGPMRLTALADAEGASQSGMTQLVQRMERQGLLERWSDPDDARASLVMVGDAGRRLWETRVEVRQRRIGHLVEGLSQDDRVALWLAAQVATRVLDEMRRMADTQAPDADPPRPRSR